MSEKEESIPTKNQSEDSKESIESNIKLIQMKFLELKPSNDFTKVKMTKHSFIAQIVYETARTNSNYTSVNIVDMYSKLLQILPDEVEIYMK